MSKSNVTDNITDNVTDEMISEWKKKYAVYRITIADTDYYYRPLTRAEFRNISKSSAATAVSNTVDTSFQMEEQTVAICLLYPKMDSNSILNVEAGVVTTLSELIMQASGFDQNDAIPERL